MREASTGVDAEGFVAAQLEGRGWSVTRAPVNNRGFDLIASKANRVLRIEVKARSVGPHSGHRSATVDNNRRQQADGYRIHALSREQVKLADVVVAVWVPEPSSPARCLVLPRVAWSLFRTPGASSRSDGKLTLALRFDVATGSAPHVRANHSVSDYAPFLDDAGWKGLEG